MDLFDLFISIRRGSDFVKQIIFHIDVNSAFLSWEACYRQKYLGCTEDLRNMVAAVGGDISKRHGVILAKSTAAKQFGVKTGESITEALKKCPNLILVPPNHNLYKSCSDALMEILQEYSPTIEKFSIDEAFVDMTGTTALWGPPEEAAEKIRKRIKKELGFTVNIGISDVKLLAKMASDFEKPDKIHTLYRSEIKDKMWPLLVNDLFLVGKSTARRLNSMGIYTIGQLANTDVSILRSHLKKQGEIIWKFANGEDVSVVHDEPYVNKGYGNSTTIAFDVTDALTAKQILLQLSENVAARMRTDEAQAEVLSVEIKNSELVSCSHQMTLFNSTNITSEIHEYACLLFDELWDGSPIRLLGVRANKVRVQDDTRQMNLFDHTNYEKLEKMDEAMDLIRKKFGNSAIQRASFLQRGITKKEGKRDEKK